MAYPDALKSGTQFGPYEIKETLWSSSAGFTYRARDRERQRDIIIQEYLPAEVATRHWSGIHVMPLDSHNESFERGLTHFLQQARVLAQIHDPYICRINEYTEANATAYLIMDYESGQTLKEYLEQRKSALNEDDLNKILIPVLKGLRVIHSSELLHLDVNPSNIFLRDVGPPVLVGFGSTHRADTESDVRLDSRVTPGYSPLELYHDGGRLGPHTDLYALGATMYRCVTRVTPVEATKRVAALAQDEEDPLVPAMEMGKGDYSTNLLGSIDWMLQPKIADRPESAGAVLGLLAEDTLTNHPRLRPANDKKTAPHLVLNGLHDSPQPAPPLRAERRTKSAPTVPARRRNRLLWPAVAAGLAALVLLIYWPDLSRDDDQSVATAPATDQDASATDAPTGDDTAAAFVERPPDLPKSINFSRRDDIDRAQTYRKIDKNEKQVRKLLDAARAKFKDGKLVAPVSGNALADYRAVQALDPGNVDAKQGVTEIVNELVGAAQESFDDRDVERAQDLLAAAIEIEPEDGGARRLQNRILTSIRKEQEARKLAAEAQRQRELKAQLELAQQQARDRERTEKISSLLAQAKSAVSNERYAEPPGDNALESYRAVLALDPTNETALAGVNEVASFFLERANSALAQDQFEEADGFLVAAAAVKPGNQSVRLLRSQLESRREVVARERRERAELEQRLRQQQARAPAQSTPNSQRANLIEGIKAYYGGAYSRAYRLLLPLAESGDARAQFRIGIMHHLGRGVEANTVEAHDWIRKALPKVQSAAAGGAAWAQADLGALYEDGLVVTKNRQEAVRWYRSAAKQGYPGAQTNLGVMYANGSGVEQDLQEAVKWFKLAAAQGDKAALENLSILGQ